MVDSGNVDFGRQSDAYEKYRPGFPKSFYEQLKKRIDISGKVVLDIGTGTGHVAFGMVERGAKSSVGLDISENQIAAAQRINKTKKLPCTFAVGTAEVTNQPSDTFDIVTAGQCWHWFDHDKAMKEINRVLKPDGYLVIAHYDYLPLKSDIAKKSEDLVLKYNTSWTLAGNQGMYPNEIVDVLRGGFEFVEQFCYDETFGFTRDSWHGRMLTCNGIGSANLTSEQVDAWTADMKDMLSKVTEPIDVWHRIWVVVAKKK